jgi:hypothetical protein
MPNAHALVERVQRDRGEPDGRWSTAATKTSRSSLRAARADRLGLNDSPVRVVEAGEDRVAQDLAHRFEHRLPGTARELDDGVQVGLVKRTDLKPSTHDLAEPSP